MGFGVEMIMDDTVVTSISSLFPFFEVEALVGRVGCAGMAASYNIALAINGNNGTTGEDGNAALHCNGGKSPGSSHTQVA